MGEALQPQSGKLAAQFWVRQTPNVPYREQKNFEPQYGDLRVSGFAKFVRDPLATNDANPTGGPRLGPAEELFSRLLETWHLDRRAGGILLGHGQQETSRVESILNGVGYLTTRDEKDRVAELFQIKKLLHALFRNQDTENAWLRESNEALENRAPLVFLLEGSMENLLRVRQFVETIVGL